MKFLTLTMALFLAAGALAAQDLPPEITAATDALMAECRDVGGEPGYSANYITSADLNGDGQPDYLQNVMEFGCAGAWSYFCGSAGCPATIWLSTPNGLHRAWSGVAQEARLEGASVVLFLHGTFCNPPAAGVEGCESTLTFTP